MRKLAVFNNVTLDGFFTDANGDMSWAHAQFDPEFNAFTEENARKNGDLIFGRVTYDLMRSYWPTPAAKEHFPTVAERMNTLPKFVFSRTLREASWNNTTLVKGDLLDAIRKMKSEPGNDMVIFGSGSIISQLARESLIDEYQFIVNPIALGAGRTMFEGVPEKLSLKLTRTRAFKNGSVFVCYEPVA